MIKRIKFKILNLFAKPLMNFSVRWIKRNINKPFSEQIFMDEGILPIIEHYYQPLINPKKHLKKSLREDRNIPGIDFNNRGQLELLKKFNYNIELLKFPIKSSNSHEFYYDNEWYESGDAEFLYNMIRHFKPKNIMEIGSGFSTLMTLNAIEGNKNENENYFCNFTCIEPYEQPWLEKRGINVIRKKIETIDLSFFKKLGKNDILFIDSSHIIRPQGDVLYEYLELLPSLNSGVIVHVHDIFSPKDYLDEWVYDKHLLWNEQYLLESFLTFNSKFKIIGALNYLSHNFRKEFSSVSPVFAQQKNSEPKAFWFVKE